MGKKKKIKEYVSPVLCGDVKFKFVEGKGWVMIFMGSRLSDSTHDVKISEDLQKDIKQGYRYWVTFRAVGSTYELLSMKFKKFMASISSHVTNQYDRPLNAWLVVEWGAGRISTDFGKIHYSEGGINTIYDYIAALRVREDILNLDETIARLVSCYQDMCFTCNDMGYDINEWGNMNPDLQNNPI